VDDNLEDALAARYTGEDVESRIAKEACKAKAKMLLVRRSKNAQRAPDATGVVHEVRILRNEIERRFRGSVVTPRATIHAAAMVSRGFTLREALEAKLPGLTTDEAAQVLGGVS
jgi:hypothetical protein